jgi:hypothetical protein
MHRIFALMEALKLPPGVLTLLNGSREVVKGLLEGFSITSE